MFKQVVEVATVGPETFFDITANTVVGALGSAAVVYRACPIVLSREAPNHEGPKFVDVGQAPPRAREPSRPSRTKCLRLLPSDRARAVVGPDKTC
jgi:hypothetical protein